MTEITAQSIDDALRAQLDALNTSVESREVGTVIQVGDGIARIDGLKDAMAEPASMGARPWSRSAPAKISAALAVSPFASSATRSPGHPSAPAER